MIECPGAGFIGVVFIGLEFLDLDAGSRILLPI
jgi:hypothetical protein